MWLTHSPASSPSLRANTVEEGSLLAGVLAHSQLRPIRWGMVLLSQRTGPSHINAESPQPLTDTDTVALIEAALQLRSPLPWFCGQFVHVLKKWDLSSVKPALVYKVGCGLLLQVLTSLTCCFPVASLLQVGFLRVNYNRTPSYFKYLNHKPFRPCFLNWK